MKKRIAIIGTVGLPASYGGFETLTEHLVENLGDEYYITVYCSGKKYKSDLRKKTHKGAKLVYLPFDANGIQSIPYDSLSIIHALFNADVLLILGVAGAWILPYVKWFSKKKIIVSIDGIEWKREKWNPIAKWYLFWAEKMAVKYSHIDISDNESIQDYTARRYGSLSRIIEYGADHTLSVKPTREDKAKYPFLNNPYAFKVCRVEPENNIHEVLEAFSNSPKHTLVLIGNWNNSEYGKNLKKSFSPFKNLILLDPIYHQRTLDVLRGNAFVYIHGHSAGGTNPALVEAMYLGLPIFTFDVSYNRTTTENKAFYFKDKNELLQLVQNKSFVELKRNAEQMKSIADRRYTWQKICDRYKLLFEEALKSEMKTSVISKTSEINEDKLRKLNLSHLQHQQVFFDNR